MLQLKVLFAVRKRGLRKGSPGLSRHWIHASAAMKRISPWRGNLEVVVVEVRPERSVALEEDIQLALE